jgi:hypothetical protein
MVQEMLITTYQSRSQGVVLRKINYCIPLPIQQKSQTKVKNLIKVVPNLQPWCPGQLPSPSNDSATY